MNSSDVIDAPLDPSRIYLTETELAHRWQITRGALANLRSAGRSPVPWTRILGRVRYDLADILAYEATQRQAA